jgi:hypothetical protein
MSLFYDTQDLYHLDWYSSPWKPYTNKLTSRTLGEDSGDDSTIRVWCAEEELENRTFTITVVGDSGNDHITSVEMSGGTTIETDNFEVSEGAAHDDKTVKWWYGPGVALQFPDGTHATTRYTSATTVYTHTIAKSDIGERVYDGGLHCWMKLPHLPQGHASSPTTAETDFYSKNIPMEYVSSEDFLIVFNSYGHYPIGTAGNKGLTIQFQYADALNAGTGQFVNDALPIWDDIDIQSIGDVNANYMAVSTITGVDFTKRASAKSIRFYWFTEDGAGNESTYHGGQFIRVSLYPIKTK